jgi:6-phosphofructokinase 1
MRDHRLKHLGVLTSGGDAPGMNATLRAVVRSALDRKLRVTGIERGYLGMLTSDFHPLKSLSVGGIISRGGTILRTVRCPEFRKAAQRRRAYANLHAAGIQAVVAIGGNGTSAAAYTLHRESGLPVAVVPASIDNDVYGTEETVGFDTAVNTAVDAIDKVRDTATSHERIFVIEVMGRENGFIAQEVGLCCGAEAVLVPEVRYDLKRICRDLQQGHQRGKLSSILVMAEGAGDSRQVAAEIARHTGLDAHVTVLGHVQRGGSPTARSRFLAARLGNLAVRALCEGQRAVLAAIQRGRFVTYPLSTTVKRHKHIDRLAYRLTYQLSR